MNEVTRVHLGRQPFTIAVDAHKLLKTYLHAIEKHVGENANEVVEEVELRIAELLLERGIAGEKTVLVEDIEYIKEQLGAPAEFGDSDATEDGETGAADVSRQLFRDTERGKLGGVAAGIAAYFDLDPTLVRIAFIVLSIAWGGGIILYIILWIVVPEARTGSDYLRMRGQPITVDSIKDFVDKADVPRRAEKVRGAVAPTIENIGKIITTLVGVGLMLVATVTALWTIAFGIYAWIAPERLSDAGQIFPKVSTDYYFIVSIMTVVLGICTLLLFAGIALIRRKRTVPSWIMGGILAIVFVGTAIALPLGFKVVPDATDRYTASEKTTTRVLKPFTELNGIGNDIVVQYIPSDTYRIDIKAFGDVDQTTVKTEVTDNTLYLDSTDFHEHDGCRLFCLGTNDLEITVYAPIIQKAELHGIAFQSDKRLQQTDLMLQIDGTVSLQMAYIMPANASIHIDTNTNDKMITLNGLSATAASRDVLSTDSYQSSIYLAQAPQQLVLSGGSSCDIYDPLVSTSQMPQQLRIGDRVFVSKDEFRQAQNDGTNIYNCISISDSVSGTLY